MSGQTLQDELRALIDKWRAVGCPVDRHYFDTNPNKGKCPTCKAYWDRADEVAVLLAKQAALGTAPMAFRDDYLPTPDTSNAKLLQVKKPAAAPAELRPMGSCDICEANGGECIHTNREMYAAQRDRKLIERGVKAGIEAAAKLVAKWNFMACSDADGLASDIRALDSAAIAENVPEHWQ